MDLFIRDDLKTLLAEPCSLCVSLFMPTHRGGAEADPIRWRKHLAEAEEQLAKAGSRAAEVKDLLAPAHRLLDDVTFWKNLSDGLAAFLTPKVLRLFRLPLVFKDQVVLANQAYITPLLPLLGGAGRFFVLALSQKAVRLLQGTQNGVSEVNLKGVPRNLAEALLTHDRDEPLTFHARPTSGGGWGAIFQGHGVGIDTKKDDLLRYFQRIDRGLHPVLREEKAPLVLAAVDYLRPIYRQANSYPQLLEQGVEGNPDRLSNQELHDRAWSLVQPLFEEAQQRAAAQYQQLARTEHASGDLETVVAAAYKGQVQTLFVAIGRQVWGLFDPIAERLERHNPALFGDVELLDLAAARRWSTVGPSMSWRRRRFPAAPTWRPFFTYRYPNMASGPKENSKSRISIGKRPFEFRFSNFGFPIRISEDSPMQLPLQVSFRHMEHSDAIEAIVRKKAAALDKFADHIMACRVVVEPAGKHHEHGNLYEVRLDITVPGEEVAVTREPSEHTQYKDIQVALRDAFDSAGRQLEDYVRRRRGFVKALETAPHARVSKPFPKEDYGFIETSDGREIYFHRHSVLHGAFDRLEVGTEVAFVEESGKKGPQASTLKVVGRHSHV